MLHDICRTLSLVGFNVARSLCNRNPFKEGERERGRRMRLLIETAVEIERQVESPNYCFNYIDSIEEKIVRVNNAWEGCKVLLKLKLNFMELN